MTFVQALVLGVVQGLTEFLPVSSSGHLLLVPRLFGWTEQPLAFDVALHVGTLAAIAVYFRQDWSMLVRETLGDLRRFGPRIPRWGPYGHLSLLLALATLPAIVAGLALSDVEERLRTPGVVAAMLVIVGLAMAAAERWGPRRGSTDEDRVTPVRAAIIGLAQASALVPGVSRSGSTIAAGMSTGLSRSTAARFSFLLATPVTLAAAAKELPALAQGGAGGVGALEVGIGMATAFACGLAAITFLLRYVVTHSLYIFVWYRIALAGAILLLLR